MDNTRPAFDAEILAITDYVQNKCIDSELAYSTAYYDFLDSLACALLALHTPACKKLLGPIVAGATFNEGGKIPGTCWQLEPVQAAFNFGTMIRWLDFNDTWLAAEWAHPSDNLGGILMLMDYLNRRGNVTHKYTLQDVFTCMIKAHEIQGVLALENSFNRVGLDHVILVKVATTAIATRLLGGEQQHIANAISNAWLDGQSLRTYRHAPNTGSRKSWAAGDATSRGIRLALLAMQGEMGYPSALSAKQWGFYDVSFHGQKLKLTRPFASYVMENILFKIAFPAEFHAQTAVECALQLHPHIKDRLNAIKSIYIETQDAAMRIINKQGPLYNPADRDHCLQYMVAIALLYGKLSAQDYEDEVANDPRIDQLRQLMQVTENADFSRDYLDSEKRSIANAIQIEFIDGSKTAKVIIEYPLGHRRRRNEGIPLLKQKFIDAVNMHYTTNQAALILETCFAQTQLTNTPVDQLTDLLAMPINND